MTNSFEEADAAYREEGGVDIFGNQVYSAAEFEIGEIWNK